MKKLNNIVFLDEDRLANYYHKELILKHPKVNRVDFLGDGEEIAAYFKQLETGLIPSPDFIIIDENLLLSSSIEPLDSYLIKQNTINPRMIILSENPGKEKGVESRGTYFYKPLGDKSVQHILSI